ncbi:MAG: right-handed parallel beta-helix repeat-containing protein [Muribaculaceae bacterium]|nr:right-handed parallel beta-helix repeat-containing protein [Muribaculaceae bacterium]
MNNSRGLPSSSSVVNQVVTELYLQGPTDRVNEIIQGQVTVLIQHQTWNNGDFFIAICSGNKWDASKVVCAVQVERNSAREAVLIAMCPKDENDIEEGKGIRGYAVVDFGQPDSNGNYDDYNIAVQGCYLEKSVQYVRNWPIIYTWLRTDGIYCSSESGDNNWPGTKEYPVKTIARALEKSKRVFLRRGDVFYENLDLRGMVVESYGEGVKPKISGLRRIKKGSWERGNLSGTNSWKKSENGNIWRLKLDEPSNFEGFRTKESSTLNNIGTLINLETGLPCGCLRCDELKGLGQDYDITLLDASGSSDTYVYQYLYLYLNENPNILNLGITAGISGIKMRESKMSGIEVRDWGIHGIEVNSDSTVENCSVCSIGGSGAKNDGYNALSYGNGIQVWFGHGAPTQNILIKGCDVRNCYDAGITMQGKYNGTDVLPNAKNILFHDNIISHCGYGFEFFDSKESTTTTPYVENCIVSKCKYVANGFDTGFRYQRQNYERSDAGNGHLRFWNDYPTGCVVEDCAFLDGSFMAVKLNVKEGAEPEENAPFRSVVLRRNFILLFPNQYLMATTPENGDENFNCYKWVPTDVKSVEEIYAKYKAMTLDATSMLEFEYKNEEGYVTPVIIRP